LGFNNSNAVKARAGIAAPSAPQIPARTLRLATSNSSLAMCRSSFSISVESLFKSDKISFWYWSQPVLLDDPPSAMVRFPYEIVCGITSIIPQKSDIKKELFKEREVT
jgi:hypothetical protein